MTVASNQFQTHNWALRHGMLTWVTRGVFLGYQRAYLGTRRRRHLPRRRQVGSRDAHDGLRLRERDPDDAGRRRHRGRVAAAHRPADGDGLQHGRRRPVRRRGRRSAPGEVPADQERSSAGSTTRSSTPTSTARPRTTRATRSRRTRRASTSASLTGLAPGLNDPTELVTGEHSGPGQHAAGQPRHDRPAGVRRRRRRRRARCAAGTYDYGITASSTRGETPASVTQVVLAAAGGVTLSWPAVCHAVSYSVYRRPAGGAWTRLATLPAAGDAVR